MYATVTQVITQAICSLSHNQIVSTLVYLFTRSEHSLFVCTIDPLLLLYFLYTDAICADNYCDVYSLF